MTAKEYLSRAYLLDQRINSKLEQVIRLKELARKTTVAYGAEPVSHSRKATTMEDVIIRIMEAEHELDEEIDSLIDVKREIKETIDLIADTDYRVLLEMRYLAMRPWNAIGHELGLGRTQLYKTHIRSLKMVETVLRTKEAAHEKT